MKARDGTLAGILVHIIKMNKNNTCQWWIHKSVFSSELGFKIQETILCQSLVHALVKGIEHGYFGPSTSKKKHDYKIADLSSITTDDPLKLHCIEVGTKERFRNEKNNIRQWSGPHKL
jgi:hypothetical protein